MVIWSSSLWHLRFYSVESCVTNYRNLRKSPESPQNLSNVSIHINASYKYVSKSEEMPPFVSFCKVLRVYSGRFRLFDLSSLQIE